jgi:hypothetical protein
MALISSSIFSCIHAHATLGRASFNTWMLYLCWGQRSLSVKDGSYCQQIHPNKSRRNVAKSLQHKRIRDQGTFSLGCSKDYIHLLFFDDIHQSRKILSATLSIYYKRLHREREPLPRSTRYGANVPSSKSRVCLGRSWESGHLQRDPSRVIERFIIYAR